MDFFKPEHYFIRHAYASFLIADITAATIVFMLFSYVRLINGLPLVVEYSKIFDSGTFPLLPVTIFVLPTYLFNLYFLPLLFHDFANLPVFPTGLADLRLFINTFSAASSPFSVPW